MGEALGYGGGSGGGVERSTRVAVMRGDGGAGDEVQVRGAVVEEVLGDCQAEAAGGTG